MRRILSIIAVAIVAALALSACTSESNPTGQQKENKSRQSNYNRLIENQPAHSMDFSPTRETKNFWIDTWGEKGKLAYVYLLNGDGKAFGYYVFEGLPVSYCTGLIPPYQLIDTPGDGSNVKDQLVPAPSIDGTFSSGSNCNKYYGKDATSGTYMEYSVGMGINDLIYDQPMGQFGAAEPLGKATTNEAAKVAK